VSVGPLCRESILLKKKKETEIKGFLGRGINLNLSLRVQIPRGERDWTKLPSQERIPKCLLRSKEAS